MRRLLALVLLALWPLAAGAQGTATLVADSLTVTSDGRLVAAGNVQAFYEGTTLSAARVTYDRGADRLTVEGPLLIREADGTVLAAERADLDPRLESGLLRGARIVLDRQLQLAAARVERAAGLSALASVAATSCQVCAGREPLWEIRAARVVHDEAAEQILMDDATLRVRGVPVLWLPSLRLPDPGNERATGLLIPTIRTTDQLGVGLRLPYFLELGRSRDLTLTPYLSPATRSLDLRYRQAFLAGDLVIRGAATQDDLLPGQGRGFVLAEGAFGLGDRLDLAFSAQAVSDDAYLLDYGYSDADRLRSSATLTRFGESSRLTAEVARYQSLREDEAEGSLPPYLGSLSWEKRSGGLTYGVSADGFARTTDGTGDAARDLSRVGGFALLRRDAAWGPGVVVEGEARLGLDAYRVADDPAYPAEVARATPAGAVTLRWPLARRSGAVADLLEPVAALGFAAALGGSPPDEDSPLVELDGGNLLALTRLPGEDGEEEGARLSLGVAWTRLGPGFASTLAMGRVLRSEPSGLAPSSGLDGTLGDLLLAGRLRLDGGFALDARSLADGDGFGKTEARLDWSNAAVTLSAATLFLPADLAESRPDLVAEASFDAEWRPSPRWTLGAGARYDVANEEPARARLALGWRNECVEVDLSVARRYTSTDSVEPSTDLGLSVNLNGFSAGRQARVAPETCRP